MMESDFVFLPIFFFDSRRKIELKILHTANNAADFLLLKKDNKNVPKNEKPWAHPSLTKKATLQW